MATPTPRQCEIARLIATEGLTVKETADRLGLAYETVRSQLYGQTGHDGSVRAGLLERVGARSLNDVTRWYWAAGGDVVCAAVLAMSAPPAEAARPWDDWTIRPVPHEAADSFASQTDAYTDYRDQDRYLCRVPVDSRSKVVRVREPLFRGDRVRVVSADDGEGWEAWRA